MKNRKTVCPACGKTKTVSQLCCWNCWQTVPLKIRVRFSVAEKAERRQIVRALHATWKGEPGQAF